MRCICTAQTNAYIVWSLVNAGESGLDTEIEALVKRANDVNDPFSRDPYYLGLVTATLFKVSDFILARFCVGLCWACCAARSSVRFVEWYPKLIS